MRKESRVYDCTIIELDKHHQERGNISVVENNKTIPFADYDGLTIYTIFREENQEEGTLIKICIN